MSPTTLGTGTITSDCNGIATFPVRGEKPLRWLPVDKDNARIRIGRDETTMARVYKGVDDDGVPQDMVWSGTCRVEGYWMRVEGVRNGSRLELVFLDMQQPVIRDWGIVSA